MNIDIYKYIYKYEYLFVLFGFHRFFSHFLLDVVTFYCMHGSPEFILMIIFCCCSCCCLFASYVNSSRHIFFLGPFCLSLSLFFSASFFPCCWRSTIVRIYLKEKRVSRNSQEIDFHSMNCRKISKLILKINGMNCFERN